MGLSCQSEIMFACPFVAPNWLPFVTPALWHILAILHGPIRRRNGRPISEPIGPICDIPPRSAILTVCYKFKMVPVVRYKFKMVPGASREHTANPVCAAEDRDGGQCDANGARQ